MRKRVSLAGTLIYQAGDAAAGRAVRSARRANPGLIQRNCFSIC
jgi:hypothetical protein